MPSTRPAEKERDLLKMYDASVSVCGWADEEGRRGGFSVVVSMVGGQVGWLKCVKGAWELEGFERRRGLKGTL